MDKDVNPDIDVTNMCRLCAEINEEMVHIFSEVGQEKQLANKINSTLPITVSESDKLPLTVCLRCILWLEMVCTMYKNCTEANKFLHSLLGIYLVEGSGAIENEQVSVTVETQAESSSNTSSIPEKRREYENSHQTRSKTSLRKKVDPENMLQAHEDHLHKSINITCDICKVFFTTSLQLQDHFAQVHSDLQSCKTYLPIIPKTDSSLVVAIDSEHCEESFPSPGPCNDTTNSNTGPKRRGRKKVGQKKSEAIRKVIKKYRYCPTCKLRFDIEDRIAYKTHIKIHSEVLKQEKLKLKEEKLKTSLIKCDYCDLRFLTEKSKLFHMRCKHKEYKTYICEICGVLFHTSSCLKNHKITKHTSEKKFLCDTCGKAFKLKGQLRNHVKVHVEGLIECTICHKYIQPYIFKRHMIQHTRGRRYKCSICPKAFYRKPHLEQHVGVHLKHTYECDICGRIYSRKTNLYPHRKRHEDPTTGKFICLVYDCKKQFSSQSELVNHCNEHTREEILVKVHGRDKVYQSGGYLKLGSKKSPTSFQCCYCESNVSHLTIYLNHMKKHSKDDPNKEVKYICSICDGNFNKSSDFLEHLTVHPEAYTFACDFCRESFVSYKHKMIHVNKVHKNDFQCKICFDSFNSTKALRDHKLNVHIEERKYPCTYCDRRFTQKRYLAYHVSIHTGEKKFACNVCSRTFRLKGDLNVHMKTHINDMPYKCSKCNFCCKVRRELVIHLSKVHSDASDSD